MVRPVAVAGGVQQQQRHSVHHSIKGESRRLHYMQQALTRCWCCAHCCRGKNNLGQLGTADLVEYNSPVMVVGGLTYTNIECGYYHTCALVVNG